MKATALLLAWNPICLGLVEGLLGKIQLHTVVANGFLPNLECPIVICIPVHRAHPALHAKRLYWMRHSGAPTYSTLKQGNAGSRPGSVKLPVFAGDSGVSVA
ncbi:UNVERIFIED_CONTAM: hypothetical protein FKN15_054230 [Acipenser sinensis]